MTSKSKYHEIQDQKMDDIVMEIDTEEATNTNDNIVMEIHEEEATAVDIDKLLSLLEASKRAAHLIAGKHVLLLIGRTGAGKTTTTLHFAGAKFDMVDVDGDDHYEVAEDLNEDLSQFAVSGGAESVTTTIQATTVTVQKDGKEEPITVCDTPGFGDTKGIEMEISNGLGIIHALRTAASVKPVLIIDQSCMRADRFSSLRKTLSTLIDLIGRDPKNFASLSYAFTRCEGNARNRVSRQVAGFSKIIHKDPTIEDKEILDAFLTDMIPKISPTNVICIDPSQPNEAPHTLSRLLSGPRIENPRNTFVEFCSKESISALLVQVHIIVDGIETSLESFNLEQTKNGLQKLTALADAVSMPQINTAVEHGSLRVRTFFTSLLSDVGELMKRVGNDFEESVKGVSIKLRQVSNSSAIYKLCGMDEFDCASFINNITEQLFAIIKQSITGNINSSSSADRAHILKQYIVQFSFLVTMLQGLSSGTRMKIEYAIMVGAIKSEMNPILCELDDALRNNDPSTSTLTAHLPNINFAIKINDYFSSSAFDATIVKLSDVEWFTSGLKNILDNVNDQSQGCVTCLDDLDTTLQEELLGETEWSFASIAKLDSMATFKECRNFLRTISESQSLAAICEDSAQDFKSIVGDFDDNIMKYLKNIMYFIQCQAQSIVDNSSEETTEVLKNATTTIDSIDSLLDIVKNIGSTGDFTFQQMSESLFTEKGRLNQFIEESKKAPIRHKIHRGKLPEPSEEELTESSNGKARNNLLKWYTMCKQLHVYWKKNGHCNVSRYHPKNKKLGLWVMHQRFEKKKYEMGIKTPMTDEKLQALANMDFQWGYDKKEEEHKIWNQRFEELQAFKEEHGHCRVPLKTPKLGLWVQNQRKAARRASNSKERVTKLRNIGLYD